MAKKQASDDEIPPTSRDDWFGAAKVYRGDTQQEKISSAMTFYTFRASTDSSLFALIDVADPSKLPPCPKNGAWIQFKTIKETGQPRMGFSEVEAKMDIKKKGYHIANIQIIARDIAASL